MGPSFSWEGPLAYRVETRDGFQAHQVLLEADTFLQTVEGDGTARHDARLGLMRREEVYGLLDACGGYVFERG